MPPVFEFRSRPLLHTQAGVSLPRFPGHLDCGDVVAQGGVRDGYEVPTRGPAASGLARLRENRSCTSLRSPVEYERSRQGLSRGMIPEVICPGNRGRLRAAVSALTS